jgi:hypothetical protein
VTPVEVAGCLSSRCRVTDLKTAASEVLADAGTELPSARSHLASHMAGHLAVYLRG